MLARSQIYYIALFGVINIIYGGLVELVVNAMIDIKEPYITWE